MHALDTCYIIWLFENHKEKILLEKDYLITSFNYEELLHLEHRHKIDEKLRKRIKEFFRKNKPTVADVPVHPGNKMEEIVYINSIDPHLLEHVKDPSDAVLVAFCIAKKCNCVTRDRHDIYKAVNENYFEKNGLKLLKKLT